MLEYERDPTKRAASEADAEFLRGLAATAGEAPRVGVLESVRRHPILALAPVVLLVVLATALGLARSPTYTADARLAVGRLDVTSSGALAGFTEATTALASAYSRSITADPVVRTLARRLRTSRGDVRGSLSASPIPDGPLMRVRAVGSSAKEAELIANQAATALVAYIQKANRSNPDGARLLREFRSSVVDALAKDAIGARLAHARRSGAPVSLVKLRGASADAQVAEIRRDSLRAQYRTSTQGAPGATQLELLANASTAISDRKSTFELYVFVGLLAGAIVGFGLATLRANEEARKAFKAARAWSIPPTDREAPPDV